MRAVFVIHGSLYWAILPLCYNTVMHISLISKKGFTLVELLVVIAIIALLSGIVMTSLSAPKGKARDAKRISDIGNIQVALALFFDRCKQYPWNIPLATSASEGCPSGITLGSFMSVIPTAPAPGTYKYAILENADGEAIDYVLSTTLESTSEIVKDGLPAYPPYTAPSGSSWQQGAQGIICSNVSGSKDYCVGSK